MQVREKGMEFITLTVSWVGGLTVVAPALLRERGLNFAWEKTHTHSGLWKTAQKTWLWDSPNPPLPVHIIVCACFTGCLLRLCYAVHVSLVIYWDSAMLCMFHWLFTETLLCCACFTGYLLRLCYAVHVSLVVYWDSAMLCIYKDTRH